MGEEVPRKRTPLSLDQAAKVLETALRERLPELLTRELAEMLLAHVWIENGRGSSIICHNWGNLSTMPSWGHDYWRPPWFEVDESSSERDRELHEKMLAGKAPQAFRAYPDHVSGLSAYLSLLMRKLSSGLEAARRGDVQGFAQSVWDSGYCRDAGCRPDRLGPSLSSLVTSFQEKGLFPDLPKLDPSWEGDSEPSLPSPSEDGLPTGPYVRGRRDLPDLRWGHTGPAVSLWQRLLGGYYTGELDGDFGPMTHEATCEWQARHELRPDGWVGPLTWAEVANGDEP